MKSVHSKTAIFYVLAVLRYVLNCDKCNCRGATFRAQRTNGCNYYQHLRPYNGER